jgi:hypothetical protein
MVGRAAIKCAKTFHVAAAVAGGVAVMVSGIG